MIHDDLVTYPASHRCAMSLSTKISAIIVYPAHRSQEGELVASRH